MQVKGERKGGRNKGNSSFIDSWVARGDLIQDGLAIRTNVQIPKAIHQDILVPPTTFTPVTAFLFYLLVLSFPSR